jgi:predicted amidophosphoribosyltransferase
MRTHSLRNGLGPSARSAAPVASLWLELLAAAYPDRCALCGAAEVGDGLGCDEHRLKPALDGPRCGRCCAPLPTAIPHGATCAVCRREPPGFARAACLLDYARDKVAREWVLRLKHGKRPDLAEPLGQLLAARLALAIAEEDEALEGGGAARRSTGAEQVRARADRAGESPLLLVPVPLHAVRAFERGYDQAHLLAESVAKSADICVARALVRVRRTPPQGSPGSSSRSSNVREAFAASRWRRGAVRSVDGADVWLVDDVLTSGATASECARVLRRMGAVRVSLLALARA